MIRNQKSVYLVLYKHYTPMFSAAELYVYT